MSLKDTLKRGLTPELFNQVTDLLGDDFDYDVVPRSRLNKVIAQRNEARTQLAGLSSKPNIQGEGKDDDDDLNNGDTQNPAGFLSQKEVDKLLKAKDKEKDDAINSLRKQNAVLEKLRAQGATDPDTILKAGLIDMNKLSFDDDGKLAGADEMITQLTKDKAYFFNGSDNHQQGTGKGGDNSGNGGGGSDALDTKLNDIFNRFAPITSAETKE